MNHFECFKNARNVVIEMLSDRGFIINEEYKNIDDETLKYLYFIKSYDIICKEHNNNTNKIYVKFIYINKIKPSVLKEYLSTLYTDTLNEETDKIILILQENPTNTIKKIADDNNCEIFNINNLQINITKHRLVPKHSLATDEEVKTIIEKYNLRAIQQLPIILRTDPVIRYYNYPPNKVCKITRISKTSIKSVFYRYIR
jgi:DNA-directed RNA polymerases I, II, and III subunit RPABC1